MKDDVRQDVGRRLKSVAGHVHGVLKMVEEDKYCIDVIRQIEAVEQALHKVKRQLLAGHLDSCVTTAIRSENARDRERVLKELLEVYDTERRLK
ncbi:MAG TPA: metal-sensitive transcriptional regulator [Thermodesulfobacteriota bacterium]